MSYEQAAQERDVNTGMHRSFEKFIAELDALEKTVDIMKERLVPILRPMDMNSPSLEAKRAVAAIDSDSPVVAELNRMIDRLRSSTDKIMHITSVVDL